jgi:hypothetical protein
VYGDTYRVYGIRRHRRWVSCGLAWPCRKRLFSIFSSRFNIFDTDSSNGRSVNGRRTGKGQMHRYRLRDVHTAIIFVEWRILASRGAAKCDIWRWFEGNLPVFLRASTVYSAVMGWKWRYSFRTVIGLLHGNVGTRPSCRLIVQWTGPGGEFRVAWEIWLFLDGGGAGAFGEFVNYSQSILGIFNCQLDGR